ncbi:MAG: site-2 protease family protein, partial [Halobacteriaceae archaeon]
FTQRVLYALQLPVLGITGSAVFPFSFAGFTGGIANFYTVTGVLAVLGPLLFVIANVLFWTAWINLNLGIFNCIPTFALDGGGLFRTVIESVLTRLPIDVVRGDTLVSAIVVLVQLGMLVSLLIVLFGPQLLQLF